MSRPARIQLSPERTRLRVVLDGHAIADSARAIRLTETGYPPRLYFPLTEVADTVLKLSAKTTHCPFKGDTRYYHIVTHSRQLDDAAWCYPWPIASMKAIAGHIAFDHPALVILPRGD